MAAVQHMTNNNLQAFKEDSRFAARRVEQHAIPELPDITPIPETTVNSGPDAEAFPQQLMNYTEEITSQRIPPMVYIEGNNRENMSTRVSRSDKANENLRNLLNCETEVKQAVDQGPLSRTYTEPLIQGVITANSPKVQEYWDEDFPNVTSVRHGLNSLLFNMLAANLDLHLLTLRNQPDRLENPVMDWIVPDSRTEN